MDRWSKMERPDWNFVWIFSLVIARTAAANYAAYGGGMILCPLVPDANSCRCQLESSPRVVYCSNQGLDLNQKVIIALPKRSDYIFGPPENEIEVRPIHVDLSGNRMENFEAQHLFEWSERQTIEHLDLSRNGLKTIFLNTFLDDFHALRSLNLSHNSLVQMSNLTNNKQSGPSLYLQGNFIDLDVSHNDLRQFPYELSRDAPQLKRLHLNGNSRLKLREIIYTSEMFTNLEELYMDDCGLSEIPEGFFKKFRNLAVLSVANNPITKLPRDLSYTKLRILNLSGTNIRELWNTADYVSVHLQELYMSHSKLKEIAPYTLDDYYELKVIDFENTSLSELDLGRKWQNWDSPLSSINIRNCRFTTLQQFPPWKTIKQPIDIRIDGNPWHCDQQLELLFVLPQIRIVGEGARCASPLKLAGRLLAQLYARNGTHEYETEIEKEFEDEVDKVGDYWRQTMSPELHRLLRDPRTFFAAGAICSAVVLLLVYSGCRLCCCGFSCLFGGLRRACQQLKWQRMCRPSNEEDKTEEERVFLIGGHPLRSSLGRARQLGRLLRARGARRWNFETPEVQQYVQQVSEQNVDDVGEEENPVVIDGVEEIEQVERNAAAKQSRTGEGAEIDEAARCRWTPDRPCAVYFESTDENIRDPHLR